MRGKVNAKMPYVMGLLKLNNEEVYQALSKEITGRNNGFELGALLEDEGNVPKTENLAEGEGLTLSQKAKIANEFLKYVDPLIEPTLASLRTSLSRSTFLGYLSEIIAATGASFALIIEKMEVDKDPWLIASIVVALLGSIFSIGSRFFSQNVRGGESDTQKNHNDLLRFSYDSKIIQAKLEVILSCADSEKRLNNEKEIIENTENLAKKIYMITKC